MTPPSRVLQFEAAAAARDVVDGYDATANRWNFSFDSSFWKAVAVAHQRGHRGAGRRVAIVDSGCDMSIPRLRARVDVLRSFVADAADRDRLGHGTAVALLLSEVAPDARLDVYQVAHDGRPNEPAVIEALHAVAGSTADVVNVSIAHQSPFTLTSEQSLMPLETGDVSLKAYAIENPPCDLCAAATMVSTRGKLVFAAAGNTADTASCPARAPGIVGAGFFGTDERVTTLAHGGKHQVAFATGPGAPQALLVDLSLMAIRGVLGTSFAAPLFAGVGALGLSKGEVFAYVAANSAAAMPQQLQAMIGASHTTPQVVTQVSQWYVRAEEKLPHVHCEYQAQVNPHGQHSDPSRCFACGILAEPIMVNHGLWLFYTGRLDSARSLLEAARLVAPWSADATANLGAITRERGDIPGAISLYEQALRLRPGFGVYSNELKLLRKRLPGRRSWWSRLWT